MELALPALAAFLGIGTLLVGAAIAWFVDIPRNVVAMVLAFGAGVLLATLALELVAEAADGVGIWPVVAGFAVGAVLYVAGDNGVKRLAAARRREQARESRSLNVTARRGGDASGGGVAIAVGALLDGIPEALVIGLAAAAGGFPTGIVASIALSNLPEGLAGTVPLKSSGRSWRFVVGLWAGITVLAVSAAVAGALLLQDAPAQVIALTTSLAAGALLAMVCNAMIPEAFATERAATGLIATAGFLAAFVLQELA